MHELCFTFNLTSIELASWVQAIGTIIAIVGALGVAIWQSNEHYQNSQRLIQYEKSFDKLELIKSLLEITRGIEVSFEHAISCTEDLDSLRGIKQEPDYKFIDDLRSTFDQLTIIPLSSLPYKFIGHISTINFTNKRAIESFNIAVRDSLTMNDNDFDFFLTEVTSLLQEFKHDVDDFKATAIDYALSIK